MNLRRTVLGLVCILCWEHKKFMLFFIKLCKEAIIEDSDRKIGLHEFLVLFPMGIAIAILV